jgi:integrase
MPQLFRKAVEIFNEMHGVALPLAEIGRQHVREFRDHLAAMDVSYETSIGRWRCVATILRHAASEDMIDTSPMAGREYVARKQKASDARKKKRLTFSVPQIELLFKLANELEASREHRDVDTGWFIRLLLFTGARGEELAQLHARDVTTINGVACIRIHDEGANNIKNNASLRDTPLHSELLKMGFLKFVESRKGAPRIFSSLKPDGKGRIYSAMSARLCRLFRKNGIKDSRIVPHSARHTLTDCLRMAGVPAEGQDDIIGHASRGRETSDRYGDQQVVVLAGYVERVNLFDMNRQVREFVED